MELPKRNAPRWIIFLIDLLICTVAFTVAYLVRFEFNPPKLEIDLALRFFPIFIALRAASFTLGKTYAGIIRYTSSQDARRILLMLFLGTAVFFGLNIVRLYAFDGVFFVPNSILIIEFLLSSFALIASRIAVKVIYLELKSPSRTRTGLAIYGAGEAGVIAKQAIDLDTRAGIEVIAFIDDDRSKAGKAIHGAVIYHSSDAENLFASGKIEQMIISAQQLSAARRSAIVDLALKYNIRVLNVPPVHRWINGELSLRQIRDIRIEDLLGRTAIRLDNPEVKNLIDAKIILVTGAAGSIGSEIVRQLAAYSPARIVLFDQAETPLYELEQELKAAGLHERCDFVIGDIRQKDRVRRLMEAFRPNIVFHAAAYKHVPLMEDNPSEAVLANILGTRNLADLSDEFGVERFVFISTDKAVNPTNVMGATKRVAEMYIQSLNERSHCTFITTRFGNVLGSNGSVIPLFKRQIEKGGPVTVTHPEVTRYFMTIPEAVELVLEAGTMGEGGEIYVFDMGESVRIIDLAERMVRLSGLTPGKDIEIKVTGLRPGEKLFEELLANEENTIATHHPKILKARVRQVDFETVRTQVDQLVELFGAQNNDALVAQIKAIVPEYRSENSTFQRLDG